MALRKSKTAAGSSSRSAILCATRCVLEGLEPRALFSGVPAVAANVPALSSDPSAHAKLYLDFSGDAAQTWTSYNTYSVPSTPAYDVDGDPTTFSAAELTDINQIWARVAEKFSPFNLDVTTIDPGTYGDKSALKIVIGGNGSWFVNGGYPGAATIGEFYDPTMSNVAFEFSQQSSGYVPLVADIAAQQAGRSFGLDWQSSFDQFGNLESIWSRGNSQIAPIEGTDVYSTRGLWWQGQNNLKVPANDMSVIAGSNNGFGYRADPYGQSIAAATPLSGNGGTLTASGVIAQPNATDYFSFTTTGGSVTLTENGAPFGQMLDGKLQLFNSAGQQIGLADSATSLNQSLTIALAAGTYYVAVSGHGMVACYDSSGVYQGSGADVGQYTLTVSAPGTGTTSTPATPSNLSASAASSSQINLSWTDTAGDESGFSIDRATDSAFTQNVSTFSISGTTTSTSVTGLASGTTYYFRVRATNSAGSSANSNVAGATTATVLTVPAAPSNLLATAVSSSQVNLSWLDNSNNETGFVIDRATDSGFTQNVVSTTAATNVVSAGITGLSSGTTYYFRVRAVNSAGTSPNSNTAVATTTAVIVTVNAPSNLIVGATTGAVVLNWTDNSTNESGFTVQRSTDGGGTWSNLQSLGANATSCNDSALVAGTTYTYRVYAYATGAQSGYSNSASITPIPSAPAGLSANAISSTQIQLGWANVAGENGFTIQRSMDGNTWSTLTSVGTGVMSYTDGGLTAGTTYYYRVTALGMAGNSAASNVASAVTAANQVNSLPAAPSNLTVSPVKHNTLMISWTNVATNATGLVLQYSTDGVTWNSLANLSPETTSYKDSGLSRTTTYYYRIAAYNQSGQSAYTYSGGTQG